VTQSPTDVPDEVLAQLGSRVQHQLRAHTPKDSRALKATVDTYPHSDYTDLGEVITSLGIGEAVVTVMDERGAPTPVAWTRLRAPESLMAPAAQEILDGVIGRSTLHRKYDEPVDRESAHELLARRLEAGAEKARAEDKSADRVSYPKPGRSRRPPSRGAADTVADVLSSPQAKRIMRTAAREIARGLFRVGRR
jgi:hypothetical protein